MACLLGGGWLLMGGWLITAMAGGSTKTPNYFMRAWQVENGLPQNKLTTVLQTRDGYIWVGTYSGLARFDGVRFLVFDDQNTPELSNSHVTCLYESDDGALWIGLENGGVSRYVNGRFQPVEIRANWGARRIYRITADGVGEVWLMNEAGLLARVRDGLVLSPGSGTGKNLLGQARTTDGTIWVARDGSLSAVVRGQLNAVHLDLPTTNQNDYVQGICAAQDGGLWVNCEGRMGKWRDGRLVQDWGLVPWGMDALTCLKETRDGTLVAATSNTGFYLLYPGTTGQFRQFNSVNGLQVDWIRSVTEDQEGNLWVGTGEHGLVEMCRSPIQTLTPPDRWHGRAVLSICPGRNGDVWLGSEGAGLYRYRAGEWWNYGYTNGLGNSYVWSVAEDQAGQLWVGSWGAGLYSLTGNLFKPVPGPGKMPPVVTALLAARDGSLWAGTSEGLVHYQSGQTNWFRTLGDKELRDVRAIAEDAGGAVWFGPAGHGLACLEQGQLRRFGRTNGLPSDYIECLHFMTDGSLWLGTFGGGLCRWQHGQFAVIGRAQGLPNSVIGDIEADGKGYFWMSSHGGIMRASVAELNACADGKIAEVHCLTYGINDGLPTMECSEGMQPAGGKTADGRLWFPTSKGLVVVDPNAVILNSRPPPVALEEVLVDGQPVTNTTAPFRLAPGHNHFEFHYTGLSFIAPEKVRFKCRLEGLENDWVDAGAKRVAIYNFLSPGYYTFRVMAANNDGIWNETSVALPFTLLPHFWQTWWFQSGGGLLTVLAASGLAWFDTRRRMRQRLEKLERQQAIERERARIAKDIHDDLGASLTRITMLSQSLHDPTMIPEAVAGNLDRIHDTARELTRSMDEIVWAVNPEHDTLDSLAGYLSRFAHVFLSAAGVRCRLDFPLELPVCRVPAEVRHNLFLAFKETLHNVATHAAATEVCVVLQLATGSLVLLVTDDGRGFDPDQAPAESPARPDRFSQGNGLANIRRRLAEIKGEYEVRSVPGRGTTIKFTVPLHDPGPRRKP